MEKIAELLQSGAIKPYVFHIYNFDQMAEAHRQVETRRTNGKVVVTVN